MTIWKIMTQRHVIPGALEWWLANGRICVGWGRVGDLREVKEPSQHSFGALLRKTFPDRNNSGTGGPSLWNFFVGMQIGDLAIVTGDTRHHVVEITGPYFWASKHDSFNDCQHQRNMVMTDLDPDQLWSSFSGKMAEGQSVRWTVARCSSSDPASGIPETAISAKYSEGTRYTVEATHVERDFRARRACVEHHGARCAVCRIDFGIAYGELGLGFIHVHHIHAISESDGEREVDPIVDLIPLCPNCHAMIHRKRPLISISELTKIHRLNGA